MFNQSILETKLKTLVMRLMRKIENNLLSFFLRANNARIFPSNHFKFLIQERSQ